MKFFAGAAAVAALASTVAAGAWDQTTTTTTTTTKAWGPKTTATETEKPDHWTTSIVDAITTYVPEACTFTHAGKVYSISAATTLTITDCPCTVSVPVWTKTSTSCSDTPTVNPVSTNGGWNAQPTGGNAPTWNAQAASTAAPTQGSWGSPTQAAAPSQYTGAANGLVANVGAGLAGVAAVAALML